MLQDGSMGDYLGALVIIGGGGVIASAGIFSFPLFV